MVLQIHCENPTYGKAKIVVILKRSHECNFSESTIGRILAHLKEKNLIVKFTAAVCSRCKRQFSKHAKPWTFKPYKEIVLFELQIDHITARKNDVMMRHFQAWDRRYRYI